MKGIMGTLLRSLFKAKKAEYGIGLCVSYPKSGRTWLRVMLDELGAPLRFAHGGSAFHMKAFRAPEDLLAKGKVLFLHRDPIDTVVSGYFQVTRREAWRNLFEGNISQFVRDRRLGITRTLRFNSMWLKAASGNDAILVTTYESLHSDPISELRRIAAWFGVSASEEQLQRAVAAGRFETMKANEKAGGYEESYQHRLRPADSEDPESFKVRKGIVGGYRQYLTDDDIEFCKGQVVQYSTGA
jgi:hypothetical protein